MASSVIRSGVVGARRQLTLGFWPWTSGVRARLPLHYKKRYCERFMIKPEPVHEVIDPNAPKYTVDEFGVKTEIVNRPIPVVYPREANEGLWGGEGIVEGLTPVGKSRRWKVLIPKMWKPMLIKRVLYSEILDKHLVLTITKRTLDLIDEAYGFDFYILKTHEVDMRSQLGMTLKRKMLTALVNKSFHLDNPEKRDKIYERYKEFIIPEEEIPWLGLTILEAELKQRKLEEEAEEASKQPLKYKFLEELKKKVSEDPAMDTITKEQKKSFLQSASWLLKK